MQKTSQISSLHGPPSFGKTVPSLGIAPFIRQTYQTGIPHLQCATPFHIPIAGHVSYGVFIRDRFGTLRMWPSRPYRWQLSVPTMQGNQAIPRRHFQTTTPCH